MRRLVVLLLLAIVPRAGSVGTPMGNRAPPRLDGLWWAQRNFGPALRGSLDVSASHNQWIAHIAHQTATGLTRAGNVEFDFGPDAGTLRLELTRRGKPAAAWWIQPPNSFRANGHETPVALTPVEVDRWTGVARPLHDRLTFFLPRSCSLRSANSSRATSFLRLRDADAPEQIPAAALR
jgi:hypothetical protein